MAKVWVHREDLLQGELPPVCVRTGEPSDEQLRVRLDSLPDWTWILLLFGIVPFLIVAHFATQSVVGLLPVTRRARERRQGHRRRAWIAGATALVLLAIGVGAGSAWSARFALAAFAVVLGSLVALERGLPSAQPDRTGLWVQLRGVHPRFAEAVEQRRPAGGAAAPA